jgi:2-oxoglutarate/2-oxoacid ferredoxin oxidoreductase subunit beta
MQEVKTVNNLTSKDFATDQEVRWCPGCGDYSILKQVQTVLPDLGIPKEKIVFISGIGCSSRFPYYMETYGMHSIHGRATAIASGLKITRPDLSIWIVTGDGDSLSIGGNHLIHLLRRNIDVNIMLFNNEIYGLTKGQYSPTSHEGQITKSTPVGVVDHPFNPIALALGANATFIARSMDRDPIHLRQVLKQANSHKGSSLVEIYQNCNVFNDGAFEVFTEKGSKKQNTLFLEEGKPLIFGENNKYGIKLDGLNTVIIELENTDNSLNDLFIHDSSDLTKATLLSRMFDNPSNEGAFPRPFGIFYAKNKSTYEDDLAHQINDFVSQKGKGDLDKIIMGKNTWEIK